MAPAKRAHQVIDLTDDDDVPASKTARVSYTGTPSSSQTSTPAASQSVRNNLATTPSSPGVASPYPSSSQFIQGDDEEAIDLTQGDDGSSLELYGTLDTKIVGVRYYNGVSTPGELVSVIRQPENQYDSNAIRIDNVVGDQIGHLGRKVVEKLAGYVDRKELVLEGILTGYKGQFDCPIRLHLYGTCDLSARLQLEEKLKADKLLKATQLKTTRKESEARAKSRATGLQSGTTSVGLATAQREEQEESLRQLVATSEALDTQRTDNLADALVVDEETLKNMPMADQPGVLKSQLLPYQLQGLAWMRTKEHPQFPAPGSEKMAQLWKRSGNNRFINMASGFVTTSPPNLLQGGILSDDMGLGKTLQVISLILSESSSQPTLIIAPVSVLSNWDQQIRSHVKEGHIPRILVYHSCKPMSAAEMRNFDVVITSYGMISTESKSPKINRIFGVEWRRVVLDEGHNIRNPRSQIAKAVRNLRAQSRWVLTGTPIINGVRDLHSLLQFLRLSGGLEQDGLFQQVITRPIRQMHNSHAERIQAVKLLGHLMADICLRRRKDMKFVDLRLPPKTEYIHRLTFSKSEQTKYDAMMAEAQGELEKYRSKSTGQGGYSNILERLLRLRQIACHWALCKERVSDLLGLFEDQKVIALNGKNIPIMQEALQLMIESQEECAICFDEIGLHEPVITSCKHVFGKPCISQAIRMQGKCPMCRSELKEESLVDPAPEVGDEELEIKDDTCRSSKTEALVKILQATLKNDGSKVIIFSQWTSFLNIIQLRLKEAGLACTRVDGSMPKKNRDAAIHALQNDPDTRILLASLQVCSVGLNLVAADTVILADSWWAPAIEDQAVDRVHRLGQTRPTTVWRLVVENTIEDRVLDIQAEKRQLVSEAFQEKTKGGKAKETRMADITKLLS